MTPSSGRALTAARCAAIGVALGAAASPPVANLAAAIFLVAFLCVPDWRVRLRTVVAAWLGRGIAVFAAALLLAATVGAFGPQGFKSAFAEMAGWRTLGLMALAFAVFDDARWKTRFALAFVVFATLAALLSVIAWLAGWQYKELPPGIILRNTVTQAMTFAVAAFFGGVLLFTHRAASALQRWLLCAAVLVLLAVLLFLQLGRSGQVMLGILVIVAVMQLLRGRRRVVAIAAVPVLAAVAFSVSPVMQSRFETAWQEVRNAEHATEYTSMGIRLVMWRNTLALIRAHPVRGYGLGGLAPAYAAYVRDRANGWKAIVTDDPHNQFLAAWVEGGLAGLLAFVFLLASVALQPAAKPWREVALALLVAWCATSMISSHFQTFNEGHLIALFLGVFLAPASPRGGDAQRSANAPSTAPSTSS